VLTLLLVVGLLLGPLLLARLPKLPPAPGGIVVSPTAPPLDMRVVIKGDADDPQVKPLVASLTGQRPQPSNHADAGALVTIEPQVQLATPEALDRIAAELERHPHIAVFPWQKATERSDALGTFVALFDAMTISRATPPTGLVARRAGDQSPPRVYLGGHVVAERPTSRPNMASSPLPLLGALVFLAAVTIAATQLLLDPSWVHVGWYAAAVFSTSVCIRQIGKYARLATLVYPVTLAYFVAVTLAGAFRRA
jgi:hypothetical protein